MKRKLSAAIGLTIIFSFVFNCMMGHLPLNSASADQLNTVEMQVSSSSLGIDFGNKPELDSSVELFVDQLKEKGFVFDGKTEIIIDVNTISNANTNLKTVCGGVQCPVDPSCINLGCRQNKCNDICP